MEAFIFDLDGTLLDTLGDIADACNKVLADNGFQPHPVAAYRQMVGNGFDTLIKRALPLEHGLRPERVAEITRLAKERYAAHMMEETKPYPGMIDALDNLAGSGAFLGVLSNKPDLLSGKLIHFYFPKTPFRFARGAREGLPLKPDPTTLLDLLRSSGIARDRACYVGDSNVDIFTARNAGILGIGAGWGFRGARELRDAGADLILNAPAEMPGLFG